MRFRLTGQQRQLGVGHGRVAGHPGAITLRGAVLMPKSVTGILIVVILVLLVIFLAQRV